MYMEIDNFENDSIYDNEINSIRHVIMSENVLALPAVNPMEISYSDSDSIEDCSETSYTRNGNNDLVPHKLTDIVRQEYLSYLEKLLHSNYETWMLFNPQKDGQVSLDDITMCAKQLELKAVRSCMIVELYRKSILKMIAKLRLETNRHELNDKLRKESINHKILKHISTQTEDVHPNNFLIERLLQSNCEQTTPINNCRLPLKKLKEKQIDSSTNRININQNPLEKNDTIPLNENVDHEKDQIFEKLEKMFAGDSDNSDIFGDGVCNHQINMILSEARISHTTTSYEKQIDSFANNSPSSFIYEEDIENILKETKNLPDKNKLLKDSLWPCELHMRKRNLHKVMYKMASGNIRRYDKIKQRFMEIFGEDSDDDFAPYSPSIEMDEIVQSSCKKRVAPVIVKLLMKPLKQGMIVNRWIFKKLAKHLATIIILENQYPDEKYIKQFIDNYFCLHPFVFDLNDIV